MKLIKIISTILVIVMLMSSFAVLVGAENTDELDFNYTYTTGDGKSNMMQDPDNPDLYLYADAKYGNGKVVQTAEEKLALMDYRYGSKDGRFKIYVDAYSGEVAFLDTQSGETLFTNPYNIGKSTGSATSVKPEVLSQLIVTYTEIKSDQSYDLLSYTEAVVRNQIAVKRIKNGVRVEYTMGREETRSLLPRLIEKTALYKIYDTIEKNIELAITEGNLSESDERTQEIERRKLVTFKANYEEYTLKEVRETYPEMLKQYPIFEKYNELAKEDPKYDEFTLCILNGNLSGERLRRQENLIKDYHKEYTYKDLDEAHAAVGYVEQVEEYPLFKMALEYSIENNGLVVRLPANGIRFDETLYRLEQIKILPYMGAGLNPNEGYTFFPDGSGTLFNFEDIARLDGAGQNITSKIYGQDYAYHNIDGRYEEVVRYPVFGIYENEKLQREVKNENGETVVEDYYKKRGFVAIIEEGDPLMSLTSYHSNTSGYNTIMMSAVARPNDSFNMQEAISVGENADWTVVSDRKYTGSFKIRYVMLTDDEVAKENNIKKYYEASYVGMAKAYREYLVENGMLKQLTKKEVKDDIPLYIETFGALKTTEKFMSIPVDVMTPLTSFGDIKTMYDNLSKKGGITNINFIMKGYTKGGMTEARVPYKLKWENAVSKEMEFEELNKYAKDKGFGLFPDFDFVFSSTDTWFDGLSLNKHAAKTVDDRYTSKREYSATKHTYVSYFELALSSAYYSYFYTKFIPQYKETSPIGISVSTLGSYINSDFDEDEPYNRADAKEHTIDAFKYIDETLNKSEIMTSGGNAYSWKYVDHITDVALDSSRFSLSSATVPFLGIVLHGYVEIAGTAINMEGNIDQAFLKSLESGAALKFILSYRNTEKLKEYETLSKYYSVDYQIWYDEGYGQLITLYKELNELLKDVQTSPIVDHDFINGVRVPDDDEILIDAEQAMKDAIAYEDALKNAKDDVERNNIYEARQLILKGIAYLNEISTDEGTAKLAAEIEKIRVLVTLSADGTSIDAGEYKEAFDNAKRALDEYKAFQMIYGITNYETKSEIDAILPDLEKEVNAAKEAYEADLENEELKLDYENKNIEFLKLKAMKSFSIETAIDAAANHKAEPENTMYTKIYELYAGFVGDEALMANIDALAELKIASDNAKLAYDEATTIAKEKYTKEYTKLVKYNNLLSACKNIQKEPDNEKYIKTLNGYKEKINNDEIIEIFMDLATKQVAADEAKLTYANQQTELIDNYMAAIEGYVAGKKLDMEAVIGATSKLDDVKNAWIAASEEFRNDPNNADLLAKCNAAKDAYIAKRDEVYGDILANLTISLTYGGKEIGGTRIYRNNARTACGEASKALNTKLSEVYTAAEEFDKLTNLMEKYNVEELLKAYNLLVENEAFSEEERADLKAQIDALDIDAINAAFSYRDEFKTITSLGYEKLQEIYEATENAKIGSEVNDSNYIKEHKIKDYKTETYLTNGEFVWAEYTKEDVVINIDRPVVNNDKYNSDANMIVYEKFENGKEFLLNFNDYRVVVEINNESYTIDAFGYVVLKQAKTK